MPIRGRADTSKGFESLQLAFPSCRTLRELPTARLKGLNAILRA